MATSRRIVRNPSRAHLQHEASPKDSTHRDLATEFQLTWAQSHTSLSTPPRHAITYLLFFSCWSFSRSRWSGYIRFP